MNLKEWIARNDMTVGEFANQINKTKETVSRYCNNKLQPSLKTCYRIIDATKGDVTMSDIRPDFAEKYGET